LLQLRLTVLALGGVPIPESITISRVQERLDEQGALRHGSKDLKTERFLEELHFYGQALKNARQDAALHAERR
jgi:hypothetical protein